MNPSIRSISGSGLLMLLALLWQPVAHADGLYIGAGSYKANVQTTNFDEDDTVPAFFVGYNFIDTSLFMFSAELGKYDLGEYSAAGTTIDADALSLAAVAYIPIGPVIEIYAKAGIASTSVKTNGSKVDDNNSFTGVGIGFDILDTVDIYAEYLTFDTDIDTDMFGIGLRLDF